MIIGTIAMIMVGLGFIRYIILFYDPLGLFLAAMGTAFLNNYIYQLEMRAGISNKLIWTQSIIAAISILVITLIFLI